MVLERTTSEPSTRSFDRMQRKVLIVEDDHDIAGVHEPGRRAVEDPSGRGE